MPFLERVAARQGKSGIGTPGPHLYRPRTKGLARNICATGWRHGAPSLKGHARIGLERLLRHRHFIGHTQLHQFWKVRGDVRIEDSKGRAACCRHLPRHWHVQKSEQHIRQPTVRRCRAKVGAGSTVGTHAESCNQHGVKLGQHTFEATWTSERCSCARGL